MKIEYGIIYSNQSRKRLISGTKGGTDPETLDIFESAMHNLFDTGSIVINSILDGSIGE